MTDDEQGELRTKLMEKYSYDPMTGLFTHKKNVAAIKAGDIAGTNVKGYIEIRVGNKKRIKAHRLAFLFMNGKLPEMHIDHKNRVRSDNRWSNLVEATNEENSHNRSISNKNTSGTTGVRFQDNRWIAEITVSYKKIYLGCFVEYSDAVNARRNAEVLYGFTNQ